MSAPERIYCRIDADLTDTGEFLGTCWRDDDGLSIPYLRADTVTIRLADAEAMVAGERALWVEAIEHYFDASAVSDVEKYVDLFRNRGK